MPKEIKKHYHFMDLSYNSSIEEVQLREKVLIKTLRAKAIKLGKSNAEKINEVVVSANEIVSYIEKNGVPNIKDNMFNTPKSNIITQSFVLIMLVIILICSVLALT